MTPYTVISDDMLFGYPVRVVDIGSVGVGAMVSQTDRGLRVDLNVTVIPWERVNELAAGFKMEIGSAE